VSPSSHLPNFLGIGVPRAGTTWLHELLSNHPEVFVPHLRKEVHFFDHYFDKGPEWYSRFFEAVASERAIGEITPQYMFREPTLDRIAEFPRIDRFIVMVRHPVDRTYSHYGLKVRNNHYTDSFDDFCSRNPDIVAMSRYSSPLTRFAERFGRDSLLVLVQEEVTRDPDRAKVELARHLGIDPDAFAVPDGKVNRSFIPKNRRLYSAAMRAVHVLNRSDNEWLVRFAKKLGVKRLLARGKRLEPLAPEAFCRLLDRFEGEVERVEAFLGRPIPAWRGREADMRAKASAPVERQVEGRDVTSSPEG